MVLATKILARLAVVNGSSYFQKLADTRRGGAVINMKNRLKLWWHVPAVWINCLAILFGCDVASVDSGMAFAVSNLIDAFAIGPQSEVVHPEILPVLMAMLATGLKRVIKQDAKPLPSMAGQSQEKLKAPRSNRSCSVPAYMTEKAGVPERLRAGESKSPPCAIRAYLIDIREPLAEVSIQNASILTEVAQFFTQVHARCPPFRDFAATSNYVQELLFILYPTMMGEEVLKPEAELNSHGPSSTVNQEDAITDSYTSDMVEPNPIRRVRTDIEETIPSEIRSKRLGGRRSSSFILVTSSKVMNHTPSKLGRIMQPRISAPTDLRTSNPTVEAIMQAVIAVFLDSMLRRKDFAGFGLFLKVPPDFHEAHASFQSYFLLRAMSALKQEMQTDQKLLLETRVITNVARYALHMSEAVFEGWFLNGAEPLLELLGTVLDYLQKPSVAQLKSTRLCKQPIATIRNVFLRVAILRLSELNSTGDPSEVVELMKKMTYWQTVIFSPDNLEVHHLKLLCYLLYDVLITSEEQVRTIVAPFWRILLVQKPAESLFAANHAHKSDPKHVSEKFADLTGLEDDAILDWINVHRTQLDEIFYGSISHSWDEFVAEENRSTEETAKVRQGKRREKLKQWQADEALEADVWHRHCTSANHWRVNVHAAERLKQQRALQDQQDNLSLISISLERFDNLLRGPCHMLEPKAPTKWQLDETEGRNRMRLRLLPYVAAESAVYQPKQKVASMASKVKLKLDTSLSPTPTADPMALTPVAPPNVDGGNDFSRRPRASSQSMPNTGAVEEDFEIIDDPKDDAENFEDKHRKVMRSLRHGDQVQHVFNVSRIVGLEAVEGLLILGKEALYLLDDFFQRTDGEIVRSWQAPNEERDPFLQLISGRQSSKRDSQVSRSERGTRHWGWREVISFSKRRFLFRDVAIEVFFGDGRSYLLTAMSHISRNELYTKLSDHAPRAHKKVSSTTDPEEAWCVESLRNPEETPQTLGSKFAHVFTSASSNLATKKWLRGELSNFHYLMLINTMAGRTFNDLTQYPVFPWVLADYTSEDLDLTDPRSFRDLSKPMGCQTPSREAEFRERYQSFAEMSDSPPFHYGTHYSSAMIVASYLIRLEPFVKSYMLLQGGNFDHADRLFHSIEKTWMSASRTNMTDVREITPEFFYLPDFLMNVNKYDFGAKQATGERINDVQLPPWAKGDPEVFITKHREALESPHVSKNLHRWIDLIFGFKQKGDAAIEATNVFHHLSYEGAKDLESIEDPVERAATIGIIHNFGQTPYQVFQRPHPPREETEFKTRSVEGSAECLTRLPHTLLGITRTSDE